MKRSATLACLLAVLTASVPRPGEDEAQELREEAFAELLTGARLVGWFTDDTRPAAPPTKDSYTIARCAKADGGKWLFESQVGEAGVTIPLYLEVAWAGDTPVITLDQFPVPGMGTFDARVLFHGTSYAGTWRGKDHGGEMMGRIERARPGAPK
jgi:hypothetical protein